MRKLAVYFFSLLFSFALSIFTMFYVLNFTLLNGDRVASWIDRAETVQLIVENMLFLVETDQESGITIELTAQEKRDIGQKLRRPLGTNLLAPQAQSIIEQAYGWLNKKPYHPLEIRIDLSGNREETYETLLALINDYQDKLPTCDEKALKSLQVDSGGIFCVPPGLEQNDDLAVELGNEIFANLTKEDALLTRHTIVVADQQSAESTKEQGENVINENLLINIHRGYGAFKNALIGLLIALVLLVSLIELASVNRLKSLRSLSKLLLFAFAVPIMFAIATLVLLPDNFSFSVGGLDAQAAEAISRIASPLISVMIKSIITTYLTLAIPLLLIGVAGTIAIHRKHREKEQHPKIKNYN